MENIQRILMIRRVALGDLIFTLPSYHLLRNRFPHAHISYLTRKGYHEILEGFPGLDEILTIDQDAFHGKVLKEVWHETGNLINIFRNNYQLIVDYTGAGETAALGLISGASYRLGLINADRPFRASMYTTYAEKIVDRHFTDQCYDLLIKAGFPATTVKNELIVPDLRQEEAKGLFCELGLDLERPTIFIQPFTSAPHKDWPFERILHCAEAWTNQGVQVLFGGGPGDAKRLQGIQYPVAAGRASIPITLGLMNLCTLVVGGDTGLLHAAVALGKRVVMLMNSNNTKLYGTYNHPDWIIESNAPTGQVGDITIEQVMNEVNKLLTVIRV